MVNKWSVVKLPVGTLILVASSLSLIACTGNSDGEKGNSTSSAVCRFEGAHLSQEYDLGFNNPIDCMILERWEQKEGDYAHNLSLNLWASKSDVMPKMFFPLNSRTPIAIDAIYPVASTGTMTAIGEPQENVGFPTGQVSFTKIGDSENEITKGSLTVSTINSSDGQTRTATIDFAVPTHFGVR